MFDGQPKQKVAQGTGPQVILLLAGGTKSTQQADIEQAQKYWAEWQTREKS